MTISLHLVDVFLIVLALLAIGAAIGAALVHQVAKYYLKKSVDEVLDEDTAAEAVSAVVKRFDLVVTTRSGEKLNMGNLVGPHKVGMTEVSAEELAGIINEGHDVNPNHAPIEIVDINDPQPGGKGKWFKKRRRGQW